VAETFNPYADWLGVRSASAQPNHYELLKLETFASDQDAILTAANVQMAKVRGIRPAERVDDWRRVLDELATAKHCLTDFVEKSRYDATLRAQGWLEPTARSGATSTGAASAAAEAGVKRSAYMEVTDAAVSNPMPPQFGSGKTVGTSGNSANPTANAAAWQPGTNLLPPSPRVSPNAAAANKSDGASGSTQPSAQAFSGAAADGRIPAAAPKPKLQFPGETVPTAKVPVAPAPIPPSPVSIPPSPAVGLPTQAAGFPAPTFPAGTPQSGSAFNQFPRPFPPVPMPGLGAQGAVPTNAVPPNAIPPNAMPQQPMPQPPFAGQFFPGGPMRPGVNPQFQQFAPGAPGVPNFFPQPPGAPNPYAPAPMQPPGGMPNYYPQQGAAPGFAGNYPPQGMPPQAMMPQSTMPQPAAPQMSQPAGGNFLDDVLSGPTRGRASPMDELGFGDSPAAPRTTEGWHSGGFPNPTPASTGAVGEIGEAPPAAFQHVEYEPSETEASRRPRYSSNSPQSSRSQQGSRTLLIGGALGAVAVLASVLIAVIVLKQKDPTVAVSDPTANGSNDSSVPPQYQPAPKPLATPKVPAHDAPNSKHPGPAAQPATPPADKPTVAKNPSGTSPNPESPPAKTPGANTGGKPSSGLVIQPTTPQPAKPKPVAVDPMKAARLNRLLSDVRHKLGERDLDDANRLMAEATPLAVTPEQTDRVARMATLVRYVGEFWNAVRDAMGGLKVTDEIDVGSTKVIVVDKDERSLTIHLGGGNKHFTLRDMPSGFAVALADRWLDPKKPENKVFVGSFYAVDPILLENDPDNAKRLWDDASAAGVSDGAYLLPLLNPEPAGTDMTGSAADSLPPVPDVKDVDRITLKVKEEFDDAIVAATTPIKVGELVQRLFDAADSSDDPVRRYVLYVSARDIAAKSGLAKLAVDAIDRTAKEFRIDALDMKADTFLNFPPTTAAGGREVARVAMALVDEAVSVKRIDLASRLAQVAVVAAQVSGGDALKKQATQRSKEVAAMADKKMASDPK
jgi:hypothetical protein